MNEIVGNILDAVSLIQADVARQKEIKRQEQKEERLYSRGRKDYLEDFSRTGGLKMLQGSADDKMVVPQSRQEAYQKGLGILQDPTGGIPNYTPQFLISTEPQEDMVDIPEEIFSVLPGTKGQKVAREKLPDLAYKAEQARLARGKRADINYHRKLTREGGGSGTYKGPFAEYFKRLDELEKDGLKILGSGYQGPGGTGLRVGAEPGKVAPYLENVNNLREMLRRSVTEGKTPPDSVLKHIESMDQFPVFEQRGAAEDSSMVQQERRDKADQQAIIDAANKVSRAFKPWWNPF